MKHKNLLLFMVKVVVAGGLLTLLTRSGKLDMASMRVLFENHELFALNLATFLCNFTIGVVRWRVLLGLARVSVPFGRAAMLQLTALFFNVVIPGNVGGDVLKALYVARDVPADRRTSLLLVVFVERLMGLAGLVTTAGLVTAARSRELWALPAFRPLVGTVFLMTAGVTLGPLILILAVRRWGARMDTMVQGPSRFARLLQQLVVSARLMSERPRLILQAFGLSMALHAVGMFLFYALVEPLTGQHVSYGEIATVYPIGILSMVLPIAPAGFGVGHVAFDRLFATVGMHDGANVFNVYLLGQTIPCLFGVVPYLALRRTLPTAAEPPA